MQRQRRRIDLLHRLARMREVEKQGAALTAAQAHGTHAKLVQLQERSGQIAASYATQGVELDGAALATRLQFLGGLDTIMRETGVAEAEAARASEAALARLMEAERRRTRASERLFAERRAADRDQQSREAVASAILARKLKGS